MKIQETMQGECFYIEGVGNIKKLPSGWKIKSRIGRVWVSKAPLFIPESDQMTDVKYGLSKKEAMRLLNELAEMKEIADAKSK